MGYRHINTGSKEGRKEGRGDLAGAAASALKAAVEQAEGLGAKVADTAGAAAGRRRESGEARSCWNDFRGLASAVRRGMFYFRRCVSVFSRESRFYQ